MSRQVFTKNYGDSQEKVFEQIEKEFNDFHDHIQNVFDAIDSSWAFRLYFNETPELDNTQTFQNVYQMEQDLEKSKSADMERLNILVVGYKVNIICRERKISALQIRKSYNQNRPKKH